MSLFTSDGFRRPSLPASRHSETSSGTASGSAGYRASGDARDSSPVTFVTVVYLQTGPNSNTLSCCQPAISLSNVKAAQNKTIEGINFTHLTLLIAASSCVYGQTLFALPGKATKSNGRSICHCLSSCEHAKCLCLSLLLSLSHC